MDYEPRRGTKGATYAYTTDDGTTRELRADDEGVVRPKDREGVTALDTFGLPVARKAMADAEDSPAPRRAISSTKSDPAPTDGGKET